MYTVRSLVPLHVPPFCFLACLLHSHTRLHTVINGLSGTRTFECSTLALTTFNRATERLSCLCCGRSSRTLPRLMRTIRRSSTPTVAAGTCSNWKCPTMTMMRRFVCSAHRMHSQPHTNSRIVCVCCLLGSGRCSRYCTSSHAPTHKLFCL